MKCLPFTDACGVPVNQVITTVEPSTAYNCQRCTPTPTISECTPCASTEGDNDGNEMSTSSKQTTISTETSQPSDGATTESSITQSTVMNTSGTSGALIDLLAADLVVVVTGWIVSCLYLQSK